MFYFLVFLAGFMTFDVTASSRPEQGPVEALQAKQAPVAGSASSQMLHKLGLQEPKKPLSNQSSASGAALSGFNSSLSSSASNVFDKASDNASNNASKGNLYGVEYVSDSSSSSDDMDPKKVGDSRPSSLQVLLAGKYNDVEYAAAKALRDAEARSKAQREELERRRVAHEAKQLKK